MKELQKLIALLELLEHISRRQKLRKHNLNMYLINGQTNLYYKELEDLAIGEIARERITKYYNKLLSNLKPL